MSYCVVRCWCCTTPCTTLYDASYIPDASGPDALYDTVRRVVRSRRVGPRRLVRRPDASYNAFPTALARGYVAGAPVALPGKGLLLPQVQGPSWPAPRRRHTTVRHKDKMYVFGGMTPGPRCEYLRDLWALDLHELQWDCLPALTDESCSHLGARTGHVAAVHGDDMWVFGGFTELADRHKVLMGDLVRFDFEEQVQWARPSYLGRDGWL